MDQDKRKSLIITLVVLGLIGLGVYVYTKNKAPMGEKTEEEKIADLERMQAQSHDNYTEQQKFDILQGQKQF